MKKLIFLLLAMLAIPASAEFVAAPIRNQELEGTYRAMVAAKEAWVQLDNILQHVRQPAAYRRLIFAECGTPNAFFKRDTGDIVFCYEMADMIDRASGSNPQIVIGSTLQIIFHEYGHALIATGKVPTLGKEEDAADQISAVMTRKAGPQIQSLVINAILEGPLKKKAGLFQRYNMADEHSLTPQRRVNMLCWTVGDNRAWMNAAIQHGDMTPERAARCPAEIQQAERAVEAMLQ